jgi:hypothetical protein
MQSMPDWQQANPQLQAQPAWSGASKSRKLLDVLRIAAGGLAGGPMGAMAMVQGLHDHDTPAGLQAIDQQRYQQGVVEPFKTQQGIADTQAQMQQRQALANKANTQADDYTMQTLTAPQAAALGNPALEGTQMTSRDLVRLLGTHDTNATHVTTTGMNNQTTLGKDVADNQTKTANTNTRANATTAAAQIRANAAGAAVPAVGTPEFASTVKSIGEGRIPLPRYSSKSAALINAVNNAYPSYDATKFGTHQASEKDFTSGADAHSVNSFNTALQHLGRAEENMPGNGKIPFVNGIHNAFLRASGDSSLQAFDADRTAVSDELARAYKGGAVTDAEHANYERLLTPNASPDQMKKNFAELKQLLAGKLESFNYQRQQGSPATQGGPVMSPGASAVMNQGAQTFNATKWAAAHPGKDVNAAIAKAKAQNMKVVQ